MRARRLINNYRDQGTKQWETVIPEQIAEKLLKRTQAQRDAIIRARELAMENATVNVVI
jgi:hypothetical protein